MRWSLSSSFLFVSAVVAICCTPALAEVTDTAVYKVRFFTTWSPQTHPTDFPPNPHFSGLIGGVHDHGVSFWRAGDLASPGIKAMAERGRISPLDEEVQSAIDAGTASEIITGGGIGTSPGGSAQAFFTVSQDHPLITLVSMVAPSPDWFVGVQGLDLRAPSGWLEEKVVTLYAWDAGTDSGASYRAPDQNTSPPEPISLIDSGPLGNGVPVGTFTFTRQDDPAPDVLALLDGRFHVSAEWQTHQLERGRARAVQLQDESGYLWFFSPGNIEVVVKVLDACTFNERFWVFAGGLTDVGVELRVEDTETGQVNIYANNLGDRYQPIQDTDAFATCP
ncbi:MAG: spondin domain-containing protein [Thermoanaerobaculia bacterium]|nr:spondin domain-containing protein [Thermoanaerobaculia bacterium]